MALGISRISSLNLNDIKNLIYARDLLKNFQNFTNQLNNDVIDLYDIWDVLEQSEVWNLIPFKECIVEVIESLKDELNSQSENNLLI